jgi:ribosomal protein S18 acetylase RimI-like enzyme
VRIEEVTESRIDPVAELFDAYRQFYAQPSDVDAARLFLMQRLENGDAHLICAVEDDAVAGFAQMYPTLDSIALARSWILHDLYVAPAFRRRGVARMLLHEARALGLRTDASLLTLSTGVDNVNAQALYEDEGWVRDDGYYAYDLHLTRD